jgi:hypothetical protein
MFNICNECGEIMNVKKGNISGYWDNLEVEYEDIDILYCNNCNEIAVKQDAAIFIQEITRAIYDQNLEIKKVKFLNSLELFIKEKENIYDWLISGKIKPAIVGDVLVFPNKLYDVANSEAILLAARNYDGVSKELIELIKEEIQNE